MTQKLILELVDGQKAEASLIGSFKPDDGKIDILLDKNKERYKLPLSEIYCIFLANFDKVAYPYQSGRYINCSRPGYKAAG